MAKNSPFNVSNWIWKLVRDLRIPSLLMIFLASSLPSNYGG